MQVFVTPESFELTAMTLSADEENKQKIILETALLKEKEKISKEKSSKILVTEEVPEVENEVEKEGYLLTGIGKLEAYYGCEKVKKLYLLFV